MAAVRGDNFLAKEKYMKQISGKINEMSEKEAEMSENGAIEIELSSVQLSFAAPTLPPGGRLLFETTIGTPSNGLLHAPLASRLVRPPTKDTPEAISCCRTVRLERGSPPRALPRSRRGPQWESTVSPRCAPR